MSSLKFWGVQNNVHWLTTADPSFLFSKIWGFIQLYKKNVVHSHKNAIEWIICLIFWDSHFASHKMQKKSETKNKKSCDRIWEMEQCLITQVNETLVIPKMSNLKILPQLQELYLKSRYWIRQNITIIYPKPCLLLWMKCFISRVYIRITYLKSQNLYIIRLTFKAVMQSWIIHLCVLSNICEIVCWSRLR